MNTRDRRHESIRPQSIRVVLVVAVAVLLFGMLANANASQFVAGTPTNPVQSLEQIVIKPQICPNCPSITLNVYIPPGITAADKAKLVATEADKQKIPNILSGNTVTFIGYQQISSVSTSMETTTLQVGPQVDDYHGPYYASLGYEYNQGFYSLTGLNGQGQPANYIAGLSFMDSVYGSVNLSANVNFASLRSPTIGELLTTEFNTMDAQLVIQAPGLASDLQLDLQDGAINFYFPNTTLDGSVTNGNTDLALTATSTIGATPEPSTLLIFGSGVLGMSGFLHKRLRRRTEGTALSGWMNSIVFGKERFSGEAAPHFLTFSAATTNDHKEVEMKTLAIRTNATTNPTNMRALSRATANRFLWVLILAGIVGIFGIPARAGQIDSGPTIWNVGYLYGSSLGNSPLPPKKGDLISLSNPGDQRFFDRAGEQMLTFTIKNLTNKAIILGHPAETAKSELLDKGEYEDQITNFRIIDSNGCAGFLAGGKSCNFYLKFKVYDPTQKDDNDREAYDVHVDVLATGGGTSDLGEADFKIISDDLPEPSTLALFGSGVLGLSSLLRKRLLSRS